MTFDYLVYGRGITREDGFALRTAPQYINSDLLVFCGEFQALGDVQTLPGASGNPWADTWIFLCAPSPCCCLLLRVTRAEGDTPGTWLQEVRQKDVWSLEGFCAPYEMRERFFASIPSLLWWMHCEGESLYNRDRHKTLSNPAELPEQYFLNPYSDAPLPENLPPELRCLCGHIRNAAQPFPFLYGAAAQCYAEKLGGAYPVALVLDAGNLPDVPEDSFALYLTELVPEACQQENTELRLHIQNGSQRSWSVGDLKSPASACDAQNGIALSALYGECEAIRRFAARMQWETPPDAPFQFSKGV